MTCFTCNSRGGWYKKCDWCGGTGEVLEEVCGVCYGEGWEWIECPDCLGGNKFYDVLDSEDSDEQ